MKKARWIVLLFGVLALGGFGRTLDLPAFADVPPREIKSSLADTGARCYCYWLGGFIDQQTLWRVDANPQVIASVVRQLNLSKAKNVPASFWKMPPHYWPRALTANMMIYQSPDFVGEIRENDGDHYFLLHDKSTNRAYVWHKYNF